MVSGMISKKGENNMDINKDTEVVDFLFNLHDEIESRFSHLPKEEYEKAKDKFLDEVAEEMGKICH